MTLRVPNAAGTSTKSANKSTAGAASVSGVMTTRNLPAPCKTAQSRKLTPILRWDNLLTIFVNGIIPGANMGNTVVCSLKPIAPCSMARSIFRSSHDQAKKSPYTRCQLKYQEKLVASMKTTSFTTTLVRAPYSAFPLIGTLWFFLRSIIVCFSTMIRYTYGPGSQSTLKRTFTILDKHGSQPIRNTSV